MTDTTAKTKETVHVRRVVGARCELVFRAWTEPEELKKWWRGSPEAETIVAEVDLRVGGRYRLGMKLPDGNEHIVGGTYREIDPPKRLVFTWKWENYEGWDFESVVTVELRDLGEDTEVVILHAGLPDEDAREKHTQGWGHVLTSLESLYSA